MYAVPAPHFTTSEMTLHYIGMEHTSRASPAHTPLADLATDSCWARQDDCHAGMLDAWRLVPSALPASPDACLPRAPGACLMPPCRW